jgi:hypothetical protein
MRIDFIGWAVDDIQVAAVRFPARPTRRKMLVGVSNPAAELLSELVLRAARVRIATLPELLDEPFALFIRCKLLEGGSLFIANM